MSRVDIQAKDGGCNQVSIIETMVDGVKYWATSGDFIYPCTTTWSVYLDTTYISRFKVAGNTIYLNNSLYWESSNSYHNICSNNTCIQVAGAGINECTTPGQMCNTPSIVTIQIKNIGNGRVWTRGGINILADRPSITVPTGTQVYFEAIPAVGETFLRFEGDNGVTTTQNPFNPTVNVSGTMTGHFSGKTSTGSSNTLLYVGATIAAGIAYLIWRKS